MQDSRIVAAVFGPQASKGLMIKDLPTKRSLFWPFKSEYRPKICKYSVLCGICWKLIKGPIKVAFDRADFLNVGSPDFYAKISVENLKT